MLLCYNNSMTLPQDSALLLSFLNMKLRDFYPSLLALCEDLDADEEEIKAQMQAFGYEYDEEKNAFVCI